MTINSATGKLDACCLALSHECTFWFDRRILIQVWSRNQSQLADGLEFLCMYAMVLGHRSFEGNILTQVCIVASHIIAIGCLFDCFEKMSFAFMITSSLS
jgi:hypothetical protein